MSEKKLQRFWSWLMAQRDRDDHIGDLANDAAEDRNAPRASGRWPGYVTGHPKASREAKLAAVEAVAEWERSLQ